MTRLWFVIGFGLPLIEQFHHVEEQVGVGTLGHLLHFIQKFTG